MGGGVTEKCIQYYYIEVQISVKITTLYLINLFLPQPIPRTKRRRKPLRTEITKHQPYFL